MPARLLPNCEYVPLWTRKWAGGSPGWVRGPGFRLPSPPERSDAVGPTPERDVRPMLVDEGRSAAARLNGSEMPFRPSSDAAAFESSGTGDGASESDELVECRVAGRVEGARFAPPPRTRRVPCARDWGSKKLSARQGVRISSHVLQLARNSGFHGAATDRD